MQTLTKKNQECLCVSICMYVCVCVRSVLILIFVVSLMQCKTFELSINGHLSDFQYGEYQEKMQGRTPVCVYNQI